MQGQCDTKQQINYKQNGSMIQMYCMKATVGAVKRQVISRLGNCQDGCISPLSCC